MNIPERLSALRTVMKENNVDAYLVPSDDDHASEYVNDHFKCREWITGFNGSAGTALITADDAWLWTDGRYFLQAEEQLRGTGVTLMKMNEPGVPTIKAHIRALAEAAKTDETEESKGSKKKKPYNFTLAFDGSTMTAKEGEELENECPVNIVYSNDLIDSIWEDRPALKGSTIREFPLTSCGKSFEDKLEDVRSEMRLKDAKVLLISDLMEIAWLFNLRGDDVLNTPVFYAYAIVTFDDCYLFTLPRALRPRIRMVLSKLGVTCRNYNKVSDVLETLTRQGEVLLADKSKTSYSLIKNVERAQKMTANFISLFRDVAEVMQDEGEKAEDADDESKKIIDTPTPIELMKAIKNETEIMSTEHAHLKDGVAVTKFIYWLKQKSKELAETGAVTPEKPGVTTDGKLTELSCCDKLESLRRMQDDCFDLSFQTIAGYMSNGAIIHYEPTPESDTEIQANGVLLVDSGGQYIDGTTDITRTIAVGPLSDKIRKYYTLVLKGHIDLAMARFPHGTTGDELDAITRKPLNDEGLDYNHGTGHGIGHVLSVHEGPNYIKRGGTQEFIPGMITSDEPGIYIEGEFGIRIESEILCIHADDQPDAVYQNLECKDSKEKQSDDKYTLGFKDITLVPFEREAIIPEMLTEKELAWMNSYHERVYSSISPFLTEEEKEWLRSETQPF